VGPESGFGAKLWGTGELDGDLESGLGIKSRKKGVGGNWAKRMEGLKRARGLKQAKKRLGDLKKMGSPEICPLPHFLMEYPLTKVIYTLYIALPDLHDQIIINIIIKHYL